MAVLPLFISDLTTVKSRLRLTGVANGTDASTFIDGAIVKMRVRFFEALGAARVAEIVGYPTGDNPTDENGILRLRAEETEHSGIRLYLLRTMPTMFLDSGSLARQVWNDEGLTREARQSDLENEIARLEQEVYDGLSEIGTGIVDENGTEGNFSSFGAANPFALSGVLPYLGNQPTA